MKRKAAQEVGYLGRAEVFEDEAGAWRFRVTGKNGEIVATSEAYASKSNALRGVRALRRVVAGLEPDTREVKP